MKKYPAETACQNMPLGRVSWCQLLTTVGVKSPAITCYGLILFLNLFKGCLVWMQGSIHNWDLQLFIDAGSSDGCRAYSWSQSRWRTEPWLSAVMEARFLKSLVLLQIFPGVFAVKLWGTEFGNGKVRFNCDGWYVLEANFNDVVNLPSASN